MTKQSKRIPPRFFDGKRLEISRILIEEITKWKSSKQIATEEFIKLVDRLEKII